MSVDVLISIVGDIARVQVDLLDSVVLRNLRGRRRAFGVFLFDGRFLARVSTRKSFLRSSRPVEWGCKVESFPEDFSGSAGVANIFLNSSSAAALAGSLAVDTSATGVWRSVPLPPLRGVCTLSVSSVDMSGVNRHAAYGMLVKKSRARSLRSDRANARARSLRSDGALARARSLRSHRTIARSLSCDRALALARSLRSDRASAWSLRSDQAEWTFGRYVATKPWLKLGRYVATEWSSCSVAV
ncbi:hypothetical protein F2Q68_00005828 [Brassica cretica]|uniref:Uncharacterized protein n=1 Tax=Brassica cretica TaxID=69181 RepID=A0A8S9J6G7_BRACR|nr:hypothetical protein F2Q68_00005828 [Brassica cretica]